MKIKKPAVASNLAMRFYEKDGWTKEELDECCIRGEFLCYHPDDVDRYFTLSQPGHYDVDKLLLKISEIRRIFDDQKRFTDRELLEQRNW